MESGRRGSSLLALLTFVAPLQGASLTLRGNADAGLEPVSLVYDYHHHGMEWAVGECGSRERQSPIDFGVKAPWGIAAQAPPEHGFFFFYDMVQDKFAVDSGNGTFVVDVGGRGYGGVTLHNAMFNLNSVNFRVGSEHTFKGARLPLEVQFVHTGDAHPEHTLIVSMLFDTAAPAANPPAASALAGLLQVMPPSGGGRVEVPLVMPADLLAPLVAGGTYFHYTGSLTAPPCTEQTTWLVRRESLNVSPAQVATLRNAVLSANAGAENWRAPMPLMDRLISIMSATAGEPPLTADGTPPVPGKLGSYTAAFKGQAAADLAFNTAMQAVGVGEGIQRAMFIPVMPSGPAPAPAPMAR